MATLTKTAKPVKPVSGTARWIIDNRTKPDRESLIEINGQCYWVRVLPQDGRTIGYRLERINTGGQVVYDIDATAEPWTCDCPDYVYRRAGKDPKGCKHVAAVRAALAAVNSR